MAPPPYRHEPMYGKHRLQHIGLIDFPHSHNDLLETYKTFYGKDRPQHIIDWPSDRRNDL